MPVNRAPYRVFLILDKVLKQLSDPISGESAEELSGQSAVPPAGGISGAPARLIDLRPADEIPEEDLAQMEEAVVEAVNLNVELRGLDAEEESRAEAIVRSLVFKCWRLGRRLPRPMDLRSDSWRELSDDVGRTYERARDIRESRDRTAVRPREAKAPA